MRNWLFMGGAALLAGVTGFVWGRSSAGATATQNAAGQGVVVTQPGGLLVGGGTGSGGSKGDEVELRGHQSSAFANRANLEKALQTIIKDSNPVERFASLSALLADLSPENLERVLAAFEEIPMRPDHNDEYEMLLYAWAKFDPQGALKYVEENANSRSIPEDQLYRAVLSSWASEDPQSALAWFEELPENERDSDLRRGLIAGWAAKDAYGAADYLQTLEANNEREYLVGEITSYLIKQGPSEATAWAESQTDPKFKEQAFEELSEDWTSIDPAGTAAWLSRFVDEEYSIEAFEDLARGWVSTDPDAATAWFGDLPDGPAKERGIYEMARTWGDNDLAGLGEWLNSLPDSKTTDLGVRAYSERLIRQSPEAAVQSAMSIVDGEMRDQTVLNLAQQWYQRDQAAAVTWAENNGIPMEQLQSGRRGPDVLMNFTPEMQAEAMDNVSRLIDSGQVSPEQLSRMMETQADLMRQIQAQHNLPPVPAPVPPVPEG